MFSADDEANNVDNLENEKTCQSPTLADNRDIDEFVRDTCKSPEIQDSTDCVSFEIERLSFEKEENGEKSNFASKTVIFLDLIASIIRALSKK